MRCFLRWASGDSAIVVAHLPRRAAIAERFGPANPTPVQDERVGGERPHCFRERGTQLRFNFDWVGSRRDAQAPSDAQDVAIHGESWNAERVAEHDIRRFAPDTWQGGEQAHLSRLFPVVLMTSACAMPTRAFDSGGRPCGENQRLQIGGCRGRERSGIRIALEQRRRDEIHPVGRLRRENFRDQQLERVTKVQLRRRIRVMRRQRSDDL